VTAVKHFHQRVHAPVPVRRPRDSIKAVRAERDRMLRDYKAMLSAKEDAAKKHAKRGELDDAKLAYEFVLSAQSRALGEEHERTLSTKHNLALLLKKQQAK
jgi:hypothetical protein